MADRETSVRYRAIGEFASLARSVRNARKAISELRKEQDALNTSTARGEDGAAAATGRHSAARDKLTAATTKGTSAVQAAAAGFTAEARAIRETANSSTAAAKAKDALGAATNAQEFATRKARIAQERLNAGMAAATPATRRQTREIERQKAAVDSARGGVDKFQKGLVKLGNWRPRLTPPFIALIPLLASVLGFIGPLIAGVGALGAAGFGLASSFGAAAGALGVGLIPALATAIGLVAALKSAFGGVGNVFKAATAARDAAGAAGGGATTAADRRAEITDTEKLQRAQERYARAVQDTGFAQDDLNEARKDYIARLRDLQRAVDRAALSEARASANTQLAREAYADTLADPGSTKGAKMDAQVSVDESVADQQDIITDNIKAASDLQEMKSKGMEQDRQVIQANRAVTDAINAQRDAQIELRNEASGANDTAAQATATTAAASATNEYQKALDALSPSARAFVLTLLGLREEWVAMNKASQESFFSQIVEDLPLIQRYIAPIGSMLNSINGAAGRVFSRFLKLTTSAAWLEDFAKFGQESVQPIEDIGDGLLSWLDAFRNLSLAAMPFFAALASDFRQGAADFSQFIADGRESGTIAAWLERGRESLALWWGIIKNIGATLFNYGEASSGFGNWLTNGLLEMTEGWRTSSEKAREEGSAWKKFLDDIKPLLSEMKGLVGDFFTYFGEQASDEKNISQLTDIFSKLRDLGEPLSAIIDALRDAEVAPALVEALNSIATFVSEVLANGGGDAIKVFFDILNTVFAALADAAKVPGIGTFMNVFLVTMAGLAALTFVGKFTGLTGLLGMILKFGKGGGPATLSKIAALLGMSGAAATGGAPAAAGGAAASGAAAAGGAAAAAGGGAATAAKGGGIRAIATRLKPGPLGAAIAVYSLYDYLLNNPNAPQVVKDINKSTGKVDKQTQGTGVKLNGDPAALTSNVIANIVRGLFPDGFNPGSGGSTGKTSTGTGGGGGGLTALNLSGAAPWIAEQSVAISTWATGLPAQIATWVGDIWVGIKTMKMWLDEKTADAKVWFLTLPTNIGIWAGDIWNDIAGPNTWLGRKAVEMKLWFLTLPTNIKNWAGDVWNSIAGPNTWLGKKAEDARVWFNDLPRKVGIWAGDIWRSITAPDTPGGFLAQMAAKIVLWAQGLPKKIGDAVGNLFRNITATFTGGGDANKNVKGAAGVSGGAALKRVQSLMPAGGRINSTYRTPQQNKAVGGSANSYHMDKANPAVDIGGSTAYLDALYPKLVAAGGWRQLLWRVPDHFDHIHVANTGGTVPGTGNTDTVPAMLTPGEVVVRKEIVNRVGEKNLLDFNRGILSYQEMLHRSAAQQPRSSKSKNGGGNAKSYFNGGGLVTTSGFPGGGSTPPPMPPGGFQGAPGSGGGMTFGDVNIYNPAPEPASDSLPRTVRKLVYLGSQ